MAKLTRDDVLKLARLARIHLTDEEADEFTTELGEVLKYVEQLQQADVLGLQPTIQVTELTNVMRDDVVIDYGYTAKELLKNVPAVEADQIKVRRVL